MITALAVENYRSLRRLVLAVGRLNVVTGPNGSGKSSLYRALRLLAGSACNGAVAAVSREGGLESAYPDIFLKAGLTDGVTLRQTVLLAAIAEKEGASQSDLVRATGVDRSTLAEMMARIVNK